MDVELYVDPSCPWSRTAFEWLDAVAPQRQLRVLLRPYSLALRDGVEHLAPPLRGVRVNGLRAVRVLAALDDDARCRFLHAVQALWLPSGPGLDVTAALLAADLPAGLAAAADDESWDVAVRAAMRQAADDVDGEPGNVPVPVLVLVRGGLRRGFHGPLLDPVPGHADGIELWDAIESISRVRGMYELSRPHGKHSLVQAWRDTDVVECDPVGG